MHQICRSKTNKACGMQWDVNKNLKLLHTDVGSHQHRFGSFFSELKIFKMFHFFKT